MKVPCCLALPSLSRGLPCYIRVMDVVVGLRLAASFALAGA
jgi:hypothetical protein